MTKQEYDKRRIFLRNEIDQLILERNKAGWSFFYKQSRTEEAIKINNKIQLLFQEKQELYDKFKGEING